MSCQHDDCDGSSLSQFILSVVQNLSSSATEEEEEDNQTVNEQDHCEESRTTRGIRPTGCLLKTQK